MFVSHDRKFTDLARIFGWFGLLLGVALFAITPCQTFSNGPNVYGIQAPCGKLRLGFKTRQVTGSGPWEDSVGRLMVSCIELFIRFLPCFVDLEESGHFT